MFCAIFAMLSLFFLIPASINEAWGLHPLLPLVLDALNVLFWFCGAIALAAEMGAHSCNNGDYLNSNYITNNSGDKTKRCREGQASDAFLWFGFVAFLVSTVLSGLQSRGGGSPRGGIRRGPAMSQV